MKKINRKMLMTILFVAVAATAGFSIINSDFVRDEEETELNTLMKHTAIQKKEITLIHELGETTPYPQIYAMAEALVQFKGYDKEKAAQAAADRYIEKRALVWSAEKMGIFVSEREFEEHLQTLIDSAKTADNYDELKAAYDANGLTFDELYRGNENYYKDNYIIDKLYTHWRQQHPDGETTASQSEVESLDHAWEQFMLEMVSEYKASQNYKAVQPALNNSKKVYCNNQTTNITELRKQKIWMDTEALMAN